MRKDFTPREILDGRARYSLEEYLKDLLFEIRDEVSDEKPVETADSLQSRQVLKKVFKFEYEIRFLAAFRKARLKTILKNVDAEDRRMIEDRILRNRDKTALLRAVIMRQISDKQKGGMTRKQATLAVVDHSRNLLSHWARRISEGRLEMDA